MEIIIQGRLVDTQKIWDVKLDSDSRGIWIYVRIIDKEDIVIGRDIPYDSSPNTVSSYKAPYRRLYEEIKKKWEEDKTDIPVFKL